MHLKQTHKCGFYSFYMFTLKKKSFIVMVICIKVHNVVILNHHYCNHIRPNFDKIKCTRAKKTFNYKHMISNGSLNLRGLFQPAADNLETEEGRLLLNAHDLWVCFQIFVASVYLTSNKL